MPRFEMSVFAGIGRQYNSAEVNCNFQMQTGPANLSKEISPGLAQQITQEFYGTMVPGIPDDVAKTCLALVPRTDFPLMGAVSKSWRSFIQSKELLEVRKEADKLEEWVYILTGDAKGRENHWEILSSSGEEGKVLPPMPGPAKAGFGVVAFDCKLFIVAGYTINSESKYVSNEMFQYDSRLNRWSASANLNVARHDFACAEVGGIIYVAGGFGENGDSLSSVEVYDPEKDKWTYVESLHHPRWGCFGCSFEGKLYVMGGRSSFSIGNSRFVDVYNPECGSWCKMKNGCVMVTAHAVLGNKLLCLEWKNQRNLAIFNPADNTWRKVPIPVTGSSAVGFCFGTFEGKLLLFSREEVPGYKTLMYDPEAAAGSEWQTSSFKPSGSCLCSVTIKT